VRINFTVSEIHSVKPSVAELKQQLVMGWFYCPFICRGNAKPTHKRFSTSML